MLGITVDTSTQLIPRQLEHEILATLMPGEQKHEMNLLGRPHQPGQLERFLGRTFSNEERELADRAFEALRARCLISPTFADIADPTSWVKITAAGRRAHESGALDALDRALHTISPTLVEIRAGAWEAVYTNRPDALRQAAHSGRELIDQTLKEGAPDSEVKVKGWYQHDTSSLSGITRRHRLRFIMERYAGTYSENNLRIAEKASELLFSVERKLVAESRTSNACKTGGA
jgi:Predicted pPIWI-associating nuclease